MQSHFGKLAKGIPLPKVMELIAEQLAAASNTFTEGKCVHMYVVHVRAMHLGLCVAQSATPNALR